MDMYVPLSNTFPPIPDDRFYSYDFANLDIENWTDLPKLT